MAYPVLGYRTKPARARGFQTRPVRVNPEIERLLARALEPPWGGRPRSTRLDYGPFGRAAGSAIQLTPVGRGARMGFALGGRVAKGAVEFWFPELLQQFDPDNPVSWSVEGFTRTGGRCAAPQRGVTNWQDALATSSPCSSTMNTWADTCLGGQATSEDGTTGPIGTKVIPATSHCVLLAAGYKSAGSPTINRMEVHESWSRPSGHGQPDSSSLVQSRPRPAIAVDPQTAPSPRGERLAGNHAFPKLGFRQGIVSWGGRRPPGRGVKERKFRLMGPWAGRWLLEGAFEFVEIVGIFHAALPKDCQAPLGATTMQQAQAVYRCVDQLSPCMLVQGFINNEIEDRIIGGLGHVTKKEAQAIGRAYGLSGLTKKIKGLDLWLPTVDLGCEAMDLEIRGS